ncbi:MAG TPA: hypothetical protein VJ023_19855 [Pyrinomonadaceae bacterium]|nr:hypothetical protein [Pyrinomonadaceae bacterium]
MTDLDEAWADALAEAERRARSAGRKDLLDYLSLRNSNDLLRQTGVAWLLDTFLKLAADANRNSASIQITRDETYSFKIKTSTMVGSQLVLRNGVRALFVEAGWPRTPHHGFVSGGGLARGRLRHRGIKSADLELMLVRRKNGEPVWMVFREHGAHRELHESTVKAQLQILLDDPTHSHFHLR